MTMSSRKPLLFRTISPLTQYQDTMPSNSGMAKGKEKMTEPEQLAAGADTATNGAAHQQLEFSPITANHHPDIAKMRRKIFIQPAQQGKTALDPRIRSDVLRSLNDPEILSKDGEYCLIIETLADGNLKAKVHGPFEAISQNGRSADTRSPEPESSGIKEISATNAATPNASGGRSDSIDNKPTSIQAVGTTGTARDVRGTRVGEYTPEQWVWMNNWVRDFEGTHRDANMAIAFAEKFGKPTSQATMKGKFQAMNESGHLEGPRKDIAFYEDPTNKPRKLGFQDRSGRGRQAKKSKIDAEDREEDSQVYVAAEVAQVDLPAPQKGRKRRRRYADAPDLMSLAEESQTDVPSPQKKARRMKSMPTINVAPSHGFEAPSAKEDDVTRMMDADKEGPVVTRSDYPMPKCSGSTALLGAVATSNPDHKTASASSPGAATSIFPSYSGGGFSAVNSFATPKPKPVSSEKTGDDTTDHGLK